MTKSNQARVNRKIVGLNCPACGGTLELQEGKAVQQCPFCNTALLVNIPGNVPSFSAVRRLDERDAWRVTKRWLSSKLRLPWFFKRARMEEALLLYAPFWVTSGRAVGLFVGEERTLVERPIISTCPAYDVSELNLQDIWLEGDEIVPFDRDTLLYDGMVLKATTFDPEAEERQRALAWLMDTENVAQDRPQQAKADIIEQRQVLLYYPLWMVRYRYWGRYYGAMVDGTEARLLMGQVSDRLPRLILLSSILGLMGSLFGILMMFLMAGDLSRAMSPELVFQSTSRPRPLWQQRITQLKSLWRRATGARQAKPADQVVPLRCPTCGQALPAENNAALFYCEICHRGVEYQDGEMRPVEMTFIEAQEGGKVPHPYWVLRARGLCPAGEAGEWTVCPSEDPIDVYVPAYPLPISQCVAQGVYLTRQQPGLDIRPDGDWNTCTVSREDALRLAELIYLSLDDDPERIERQLELISSRLVVFLSA